MVQKNLTEDFFRRALLMAVATLVAVAGCVSTPMFSSPAHAARTKATKFEVCHRTNAIKNPYRLISVAWSSVNPDNNGHDNPVHDGPVFDIANPTASHGTTPRDSGLGAEAADDGGGRGGDGCRRGRRAQGRGRVREPHVHLRRGQWRSAL